MRLLQDRASAQAELRGEAVAISDWARQITYAELEAQSNRLARQLRASGCRRGDRICFLTPKTPTAITSMLGILKADCIYVPLDPQSPPARLQRIIEASEPRLILCASALSEQLSQIVSRLESEGFRRMFGIGWLDQKPDECERMRGDFVWSDLKGHSSSPLDYRNTGRDAAHILFTSGSTGAPKGVVITHDNVRNFIDWAVTYLGIRHGDKISCHPPLHLDLSTFDIFGTFTAGAELHLVPAELNLLPHRLAEFIRERALTQWFSVPSALTYMARHGTLREGDFPMLKRLLWCGEVFPTPSLIYWMKRLPHVSFTNLYGPTETTIASSYYTISTCPRSESAQIPIGTACDGEELLVLDQELRPAPPGEIGQLYIRGAGLSPGYWRDEQKTAAAFIINPATGDPKDRLYRTGDLAFRGADGLFYYIGRTDTQIKSRGYRIELGEIETALNALGLLAECAVVAIAGDGFEGVTICCAYSLPGSASITPAVLRSELAERLPPYMLPSRWLELPALPKNANGKIDRTTLRELFNGYRTAGRA